MTMKLSWQSPIVIIVPFVATNWAGFGTTRTSKRKRHHEDYDDPEALLAKSLQLGKCHTDGSGCSPGKLQIHMVASPQPTRYERRLTADEVSFHPIAPIVLAVHRPRVDRALRPRANAALVVDDPVGAMTSDDVIGGGAVFFPRDESLE